MKFMLTIESSWMNTVELVTTFCTWIFNLVKISTPKSFVNCSLNLFRIFTFHVRATMAAVVHYKLECTELLLKVHWTSGASEARDKFCGWENLVNRKRWLDAICNHSLFTRNLNQNGLKFMGTKCEVTFGRWCFMCGSFKLIALFDFHSSRWVAWVFVCTWLNCKKESSHLVLDRDVIFICASIWIFSLLHCFCWENIFKLKLEKTLRCFELPCQMTSKCVSMKVQPNFDLFLRLKI